MNWTGKQKGQVHWGVLRAFESVKTEIKKYLSNLSSIVLEGEKYTSKEIFVTGHSLGGALATLMAAHLVDLGCKKVTLYTYGSLRVATKEFVDNYQDKITSYRFVNSRDIITCLPTQWMNLNPKDSILGILFPTVALLNMLVDFDDDNFTHFKTPVVITKDGRKSHVIIRKSTYDASQEVDEAKKKINHLIDALEEEDVDGAFKVTLEYHSIHRYIDILMGDLIRHILTDAPIKSDIWGKQFLITKREKILAEKEKQVINIKQKLREVKDERQKQLKSGKQLKLIAVKNKNGTISWYTKESIYEEILEDLLRIMSNINDNKKLLEQDILDYEQKNLSADKIEEYKVDRKFLKRMPHGKGWFIQTYRDRNL